MFRTVKCHVFQEVSQSPLVIIFVNGTHFLSDVEISHMLRVVVVTDVIGQPIVEFTYSHLRVNGQRCRLRHGCCAKQHQCSTKEEFNFHDYIVYEFNIYFIMYVLVYYPLAPVA